MSDFSLHALDAAASAPSIWGAIAAVFGAFAAARACAASVQSGQRPAPADLRRLGISPADFARIRLR